ncbi:MAG: outer membrane beta-barrel protein [Bacteroidetes bacterium]|nr:outer membrane beta-barrel protein [Bacteroidota bacterium]
MAGEDWIKIKDKRIRLFLVLTLIGSLRHNRRITFIILLFILLFSGKGFSQTGNNWILNLPRYDQELFHFGFVLGVNQSLVTIRPISDMATHSFDSTYLPDILPVPDSGRIYSITSTATPGFVISIVSDLTINQYLNLRFIPSLAFGDRTLNYSILVFRKNNSSIISISKKVPSTYVNFPLELKFKSARYNNFAAYLMTGAQYTLDLASQAKKREQRANGEKIVKFNASDIYAEAGVGFDFYNEWFKFGLELKMMYGWFDVLKRERNIYTNGIESLKSKIFQISFTFE